MRLTTITYVVIGGDELFAVLSVVRSKVIYQHKLQILLTVFSLAWVEGLILLRKYKLRVDFFLFFIIIIIMMAIVDCLSFVRTNG